MKTNTRSAYLITRPDGSQGLYGDRRIMLEEEPGLPANENTLAQYQHREQRGLKVWTEPWEEDGWRVMRMEMILGSREG